MSSNRLQCNGTTRNGTRCKIKAPAASPTTQQQQQQTTSPFYCHHHRPSTLAAPVTDLSVALNGLSLNNSPLPSSHRPQQLQQNRHPTKAFIYAYTLVPTHSNVHVMSSSTGKFTPLVSSLSVKKKPWWRRSFSSKHTSSEGSSGGVGQMLIKVGYTTKTPEQRLAQWRLKCKHPIFLLVPTPQDHYEDYFDYTLKGWPIKLQQSQHHQYNNINNTTTNHKTFSNTSSLPLQIESAIHQNLWSLFGKGKVLCHGCVTPQSSKDTNNVHLEWFLIPDDPQALAVVYSVIQNCINTVT